MPASNYDPVSSALKNSFNKVGSSRRSIDEQMESSLQKSLLVPVQFDDPVTHSHSAIKSSYIMLTPKQKPDSDNSNSSNSNGCSSNGSINNSQPSNKPTKLDQVPDPKVTLFRREQIQLGHSKMGGAGSGMWNMGNTCYLNSTLQALFHIPAFANYLRQGGHESECNLSGFSSCTICILTSTLKQTLQGGNVMKPTKLYEKLKFICKHLVHGRQEDAHEFLRYLVESLQRCYLIARKVPKTIDNYSKETTPFNQIFGGYMRQELHCLKCRHVSITFQHFMDLLLDIRNSDTVDSALSGYFKKEVLSQEDMYKCEKCKQKVPAYKIYKMERPPLVLCIQLKRFNMMGGKNGRPVTLAKTLDVSNYVRWSASAGLKFRYRLVSLINHVGPSPNCGHYTAIGEAPNGSYYRFDDSSVNPISVQSVVNTSAYVIFYEMSQECRDAYLNRSTSKLASIGPQLPHSSTNSKVLSSKPTNHQPLVQAVQPQVKPRLISDMVKPKLISEPSPNKLKLIQESTAVKPKLNTESPKLAHENKLGVVLKQSSTKSSLTGLVPYDGDDSSSEEESAKLKLENAGKSLNGEKAGNIGTAAGSLANRSSPGSGILFGSSSFLPRAVAQQIKRNKDPESVPSSPSVQDKGLSLYDEKDLNPGSKLQSDRPSSGQIPANSHVPATVKRSDSIDATSSQERLGITVLDKESHNPSIHSDNSSGSTHSFTVTDIRSPTPTTSGSGTARSSSSSGTPRSSSSSGVQRNGWTVTPQTKREHSVPTSSARDTGLETGGHASPSKKVKLELEKEKMNRKSVLDDMKLKTTETLREFGKDVLSAGARFKQQFRSNKVTDKLLKMGRNEEEEKGRLGRSHEEEKEESITSCQPSTSTGSSKALESAEHDEEDDKSDEIRKKKHKKKKKKDKKRSSGSDTDDEWEEKTKDNLEKFKNSEKSASYRQSPVRDHLDRSEKGQGDRPQKLSGWNPDAPVSKWNSKPDMKAIGRSSTWDGSGSGKIADEIKKMSTISSWNGSRSITDLGDYRKRGAESEDDEEMDRGRCKKVKRFKEERNYDRNPFQEVQSLKDRSTSYRGKYERDERSASFGRKSGASFGGFSRRGSYDRRDSSDHRNHHRDNRSSRDSSRDGDRHRNKWDHSYHRDRGSKAY